jgi:hypothetical protein
VIADLTTADLLRIVPLWGAFLTLIGLLVRQVLPWRKLTIDAATQIRAELQERVKELKADHRSCAEELAKERVDRAADVRSCREECDIQTNKLEQKILGMERSRVQEQISFINAIIDSIDAPELKVLVKSLESVQASLRVNVLHMQDERVIQSEKPDAE